MKQTDQIKHRITGEILCEGKTLAEVLEDHELWLKSVGKEGKKADLREADMREADMRWADLQGAYLQGAYLQGADLRWVDLQGANLQWADLRDAVLQGANLQRGGFNSLKTTPSMGRYLHPARCHKN